MSATLAATSIAAVVGLGTAADPSLITHLVFSLGGLLSGLGFGSALRRVLDVK